MRKVNRIAKYVTGTWDYGTGIRKDEGAWDRLDVYCDSDWAACPRTRRSTSGIALKIRRNTLGTWSKAQAMLALSSGEAFFVAMNQGVIEVLAARSLLSDVYGKTSKIAVHTDSTAARAMALKSGTGRVQHIDLKMTFTQELVAAKIVEIRKIGTLDNPATC